MWQLQTIQAKNVAAFKSLEYDIHQGVTTLIFGQNLDDDSQGSNGSGKSALIEAISISLTGEALRKVKADEIINDEEDVAWVNAVYYNTVTEKTFVVERVLDRKKPQQIYCFIDSEEIPQPTVADYNKFVLETIGITKEQLYADYILSKHKYVSFLSASDKDKKEIINNFSNANLIDTAIEAIDNDTAPYERDIDALQLRLSSQEGGLEATRESLNTAKESQAKNQENRQSRIHSLTISIADNHKSIRQDKESISKADDRLIELDNAYNKIVDLEKREGSSIINTYSELKVILDSMEITGFSDYQSRYHQLSKDIDKYEEQYSTTQKLIETVIDERKQQEEEYGRLTRIYNQDKTNIDSINNKLKQQEDECLAKIREAHDHIDKLNKDYQTLSQGYAHCVALLAGTITCPKCKHQFLLNNESSVESLRNEKTVFEVKMDTVKKNIQSDNEVVASNSEQFKDIQKEARANLSELSESLKVIQHLAEEVNQTTSKINSIEVQLGKDRAALEAIKSKCESMYDDMMDEAYSLIDKETTNTSEFIDVKEYNIKRCEQYNNELDKTIRDLQSESDDTIIEKLEGRIKEYEKAIEDDRAKLRQLTIERDSLLETKGNLVSFKTYLANTKIDALAELTNSFLEAIHSDIRLKFSGYTVLKSGKIRDKISISLIRDGIDCGSFDKFSEGEKTRVNLANILAMHELTNSACGETKGLDLLILDEILEATDEEGLANMFQALNNLQLTSLVVSHGNVAENYPHRLIVKKLNGISSI